MVAFGLNLMQLGFWALSSPFYLLILVFQLWMFIDAVRRREFIWAAFIFIGSIISTLLYYLYVYRDSPSATSGFQLPGAVDRRRIKDLQAKIHHLDKPHHYSQLGDIYFQQGKLDKAEQCYRAAMERDPQDIDTRAHFGQCLLRAKRAAEARPLLEGVVAENPKHDYGYSQMALAETYMALSENEKAFDLWKQVVENHSYARAKVQLAEIYVARNQPNQALTEVLEVISDDAHAPTVQRRRDRIWIKRARNLMAKLK
jgi:tetratricopeptide (TPR) repeat protein